MKVQKTAEVPRTQFIDRVVNIPVVQQRQEVVQKIVEMYRYSTNGANGSEDRGGYTAVLDKVVDMSVVVQRQVPMVQMVQNSWP